MARRNRNTDYRVATTWDLYGPDEISYVQFEVEATVSPGIAPVYYPNYKAHPGEGPSVDIRSLAIVEATVCFMDGEPMQVTLSEYDSKRLCDYVAQQYEREIGEAVLLAGPDEPDYDNSDTRI